MIATLENFGIVHAPHATVEYIGENRATVTFRGIQPMRIYRFGKNAGHIRNQVHVDDLPIFRARPHEFIVHDDTLTDPLLDELEERMAQRLEGGGQLAEPPALEAKPKARRGGRPSVPFGERQRRHHLLNHGTTIWTLDDIAADLDVTKSAVKQDQYRFRRDHPDLLDEADCVWCRRGYDPAPAPRVPRA